MEKSLFTEMDMGANLQTFEDELRKLMDAFQKATKTQIQDIHLHYSGHNQARNITVRVGKIEF
jgi:hypothetical protein